MAKRPVPVTDPRPSLSRDRVLQAAMDLADRGGIDSLSMRKLAEELGVEAMSLYYYVANKDDILAGMVDRVRSEIDTPSADAGWKAAIRRGAISAHDILLRHPWAGGLMVSARHISPARLGYAEWLLRRLREAGFSPEVTHHAYHALDGHIIGSALWEVGYPGGNDPADSAKAVALLRALPIDQYPYIAEHMAHHAKFSRADRNAFEFGLDLILDGLERIRGSPGASSG